MSPPAAPSGPDHERSRRDAERVAIIVGPMNVGKSALFNRLTGAGAVTANYPGTSVEISTGSLVVGGRRYRLVDTPGIGGIYCVSDEERVTQELLLREPPDLIICVADAKNLRRSLVIALQVAGFGVPMVMAVNMVDEARKRGIRVDEALLAARLGIPVVSTVAVEGHGIRALRSVLEEARVSTARAEQAPEVEVACMLMDAGEVATLRTDCREGRRNPIEIKESIAHHVGSLYHGAE